VIGRREREEGNRRACRTVSVSLSFSFFLFLSLSFSFDPHERRRTMKMRVAMYAVAFTLFLCGAQAEDGKEPKDKTSP
jgi:hypothetical protein